MYYPVRSMSLHFSCAPLDAYRLPYVVMIFKLPEDKLLRFWQHLMPTRNRLNLDKIPTFITMPETSFNAMIPGVPVTVDSVQFFYPAENSVHRTINL